MRTLWWLVYFGLVGASVVWIIFTSVSLLVGLFSVIAVGGVA